MDIAEVVDRESLEAYLNGLPDDVQILTVRRFVFFAAVSVAPIGLRVFADNALAKSRDMVALPMFGALSIAGVTGTWPTPEIDGGTAYAAGNVGYSAIKAADPAFFAAVYIANAAYAAVDATLAAKAVSFVAETTVVWETLRHWLKALQDSPKGPLFSVSLDQDTAAAWAETRRQLEADTAGQWTFWINFYERVLAGKDIHAAQLAPILNGITKEDWLGDPALVNVLFDGVLAVYRAEDAGHAGTSERPKNATQHVKAIRSQVSTLRDFLDVEYLNLSGHNARSPEQDDVLDLLRDLKALVDELMERLDGAEDEGRALVLVQENLPAVIEKAGELAIVEPEPLVSATTVTMAATIKLLVDSGADPKLATQIAMGDAATKKLLPIWRRILPWGRKSGDLP